MKQPREIFVTYEKAVSIVKSWGGIEPNYLYEAWEDFLRLKSINYRQVRDGYYIKGKTPEALTAFILAYL